MRDHTSSRGHSASKGAGVRGSAPTPTQWAYGSADPSRALRRSRVGSTHAFFYGRGRGVSGTIHRPDFIGEIDSSGYDNKTIAVVRR
jgi:hypothetical protein